MKYKFQKFLSISKPHPFNFRNEIGKILERFQKLFSKVITNKSILLLIALSLPAVLIWIFSSVAFVWQFLSTNWFSNLSPKIYLFILLLMPFASFNLSLWFYFKTKNNIYWNATVTNIILLVLVIGASILFPT